MQTGPVASVMIKTYYCKTLYVAYLWLMSLSFGPLKPDPSLPSRPGGCAPAPAHLSHRALRVLSLPEQWQRLHRPLSCALTALVWLHQQLVIF